MNVLLWLALAHGQSPEDLAPRHELPFAASPEQPDLAGTWRMTLRVANRAAIPLLGDTTVWSISTFVAHITQDGGQFTQRHVTCDIDTRSTRRIAEHILPIAFVEAMPVKTYPLELNRVGDKWAYHGDLGEIHIGYDPLRTGGKLPEKGREEGVLLDWDNDGKVGATVLLKVPVLGVMEVYLIQDTHVAMHGTVVTEDLIYGRVELPVLDQRIVDASNLLLRGNPRIHPDPANSSFRMVRLPADTTCADLGLPRPRPDFK